MEELFKRQLVETQPITEEGLNQLKLKTYFNGEENQEKIKTDTKQSSKVLSQEAIKSCHSFWHRECQNKDNECYRCDEWY